MTPNAANLRSSGIGLMMSIGRLQFVGILKFHLLASAAILQICMLCEVAGKSSRLFNALF
jgi:hypothetical protein